MAPEGTIFGTDSAGNFKVRPEKGGRTVILVRSSRKEFNQGESISYINLRPGQNVDFADDYNRITMSQRVSQPAARTHVETPREGLDKDGYRRSRPVLEIGRIVHAADMTGSWAMIVYESSPLVCSDFPFVAIAKDSKLADKASDILYEWGFGGGGSIGPNFYQGSNGLFGLDAHMNKDFRPKVKDNPRQEGRLFVPVDGLSWGFGYGSPTILAIVRNECVESARFV